MGLSTKLIGSKRKRTLPRYKDTPPRWHLSSSFGKFVAIFDFFYVFGCVNAKSRWFLLRLRNFYLKIEFCMNDFAENLQLTSDHTCNAGKTCFAGSRVSCQQSFEIVGIAMQITLN